MLVCSILHVYRNNDNIATLQRKQHQQFTENSYQQMKHYHA